MTKREQILQAILTNLKTITGVEPENVVRSRTYPFDGDRLPFISLFPIIDPRSEPATSVLESFLRIRISVWVEGDVPDSVADPVIEQIDDLMLGDRSLGGLALDVAPVDVAFNFSDGNKPEVQIDMEFIVQYRKNLTF